MTHFSYTLKYASRDVNTIAGYREDNRRCTIDVDRKFFKNQLIKYANCVDFHQTERGVVIGMYVVLRRNDAEVGTVAWNVLPETMYFHLCEIEIVIWVE